MWCHTSRCYQSRWICQTAFRCFYATSPFLFCVLFLFLSFLFFCFVFSFCFCVLFFSNFSKADVEKADVIKVVGFAKQLSDVLLSFVFFLLFFSLVYFLFFSASLIFLFKMWCWKGGHYQSRWICQTDFRCFYSSKRFKKSQFKEKNNWNFSWRKRIYK